MAVTHADLAPNHRDTDLGGRTGVVLVALTFLFGLACFVLCLVAEATRSQVAWEGNSGHEGKGHYACVYSGSGKKPLFCAAAAFLGLAVAMVVEHVYLLISVSKSPPPVLATWDPEATPTKSLTLQAAFFFVATWVCFAVGEILLLIGLGVESGHLKDWGTPRPSCLVIREGVFSAAGVFALLTLFFASGLYLTAVKAYKISREIENTRREVLEASALFASPPRSPLSGMRSMSRETPLRREEGSLQLSSLKRIFSDSVTSQLV